MSAAAVTGGWKSALEQMLQVHGDACGSGLSELADELR